jgi:hypothetical protein
MPKSSAPKVAARKTRNTHHKIGPKVAARKTRDANPKTASKDTGKARDNHHKTAPKVAAEKMRNPRKTAWKAGESAGDTEAAVRREQFRGTQVPDTLRALAEWNVAQTREWYERSEKTLKSVLESWQNSLSAAGQGAVALNSKIIDIAGRNIKNGFDLATGLAGAKNFVEVTELQAAYWRKQFKALSTERVRALSTK